MKRKVEKMSTELKMAQMISVAGAGTGQLYKRSWVTQEVINPLGTTKWELRDEVNRQEEVQEATHPAPSSYSDAALNSHVSGVVQGPADSKVPVKGHGRQEEGLSGAHGEEEVELEEAAIEGDGAGFRKQVGKHIGDSRSDIPHLQEGKIGQQDVHGGMEMVVPPHCTDNAQVSSQCQDIDCKEG